MKVSLLTFLGLTTKIFQKDSQSKTKVKHLAHTQKEKPNLFIKLQQMFLFSVTL